MDSALADDVVERLYSPSSIVAEYFKAGQSYPLDEFQTMARIALERASDRVARKYGYACTAAMAQLDRIEVRIVQLQGKGGQVACLNISQRAEP